jgi:hypothetical protein
VVKYSQKLNFIDFIALLSILFDSTYCFKSPLSKN